MATLKDAVVNVEQLRTLELHDEQPAIESEPTSVVYEVSFDTNFADRTAFITGIGRYNEEATVCSNLVRPLVCKANFSVKGDGLVIKKKQNYWCKGERFTV